MCTCWPKYLTVKDTRGIVTSSNRVSFQLIMNISGSTMTTTKIVCSVYMIIGPQPDRWWRGPLDHRCDAPEKMREAGQPGACRNPGASRIRPGARCQSKCVAEEREKCHLSHSLPALSTQKKLDATR